MSVREAHLRIFRCRTGCRSGDLTRPEHVCHGWKPGGSPEDCLRACARNCAPAGLGGGGAEITRGIGAIACKSQSSSRGAFSPKFRRGANFLQERAANAQELQRQFPPIQDVEGLSEKHTELLDAIEFGDKESILALTDSIQQGFSSVTSCHPQWATWLREDRVWLERMSCGRSQQPKAASIHVDKSPLRRNPRFLQLCFQIIDNWAF